MAECQFYWEFCVYLLHVQLGFVSWLLSGYNDAFKACLSISSYSSEFSAITVIFSWAYFPLSFVLLLPTVWMTLGWYSWSAYLILKLSKQITSVFSRHRKCRVALLWLFFECKSLRSIRSPGGFLSRCSCWGISITKASWDWCRIPLQQYRRTIHKWLEGQWRVI